MKLAEWQKEQFRAHLGTMGNGACQVCGSKTFDIFDEIIDMRLLAGGTDSVPVLFATCRTCGQILMVSAIKLGFVKSPFDG